MSELSFLDLVRRVSGVTLRECSPECSPEQHRREAATFVSVLLADSYLAHQISLKASSYESDDYSEDDDVA